MIKYRSDRGSVRSIHVQVDEQLYQRLERYCDVASLSKVIAVQRGIRWVLRDALTHWPVEMLIPEVSSKVLTTPT